MSRSGWLRGVNALGLRVDGKQVTPAVLKSAATPMIARGEVLDLHDGLQVRPEGAFAALEALPPAELEQLAGRFFLGDRGWMSAEKVTSLFRVALVLDSPVWQKRAVEARKSQSSRWSQEVWLCEVLGYKPEPRWLKPLQPMDRELYLTELVALSTCNLWELEPEVVALDVGIARPYLALRGEVGAEAPDELAMLVAFARGDHGDAARLGLRAVVGQKRRKYRQLRGLEGVLHTLCCLATHRDDAERWQFALRATRDARAAKAGFDLEYEVIALIIEQYQTGKRTLLDGISALVRYYRVERESWVLALVLALALGMVRQKGESSRTEEDVELLANTWLRLAKDNGFAGIAREFEAALAKLAGETPAAGTLASHLRLTDPWTYQLAALEAVAGKATIAKAKSDAEEFRPYVRWAVSLGFDSQAVSVSPYWVKSARSVKGAAASVSTLLRKKASLLSAADRAVLEHVFTERSYAGYPGREYLAPSALVGLIDHPHATRADGTPIEVVRGTPRLEATRTDEGTRLSVFPPSLSKRSFAFEEAPGRVVVYVRDAQIESVVEAMQGSALVVPEEATERLSGVLSKLSAVVEIRAQADVEIGGEEVAADPQPLVRLGWDGTTLSAEVVVAPLGLEGPHVHPGLGARGVAATIEGKPLRALRDLEAETERRDALYASCPTLAAGHGVYTLVEALLLLMELEDARELATVVWPRGRPLKAPRKAEVSNLNLRVGQGARWLEVEAEVVVDENTVLSYRELIERRGQRFIPIGEGRFVALSEELRGRLDALDAISTPHKELANASLATLPFLAEIGEGAGAFVLDDSSAKRRADFERALKLRPRVPKAFTATLRDYQSEGFQWMARLAEAGLGACLADDMGLGKTVQSLALLTSRRKRGPALVVVPSSVAFNWVSEAERFAPALRVVRLDQVDDRAATIAALGASDVLVCSYGLLAREAEHLAAVRFDTVIFDEAHLLKNAGTRRAKAARSLDAQFRLSLTGTPIENHVGELWSLMEATVPGLLDTAKRFKNRFAQPIADGNEQRLEQLRALVRPFMLRRTKDQVLGELPPRTETTLVVSPDPKERAFYEALRRRALEKLDETDPQSRIILLAHLTKLRMAAVDPRLVDPSGPPGAKLGALLERIEALREEGHRVLVFSQFLGSLEQVADALSSAGVVFQTLDGSTSARERKRRIEAFQDGEGDVFIISLKAGGVGVNLTGADYVIHMDPWWNPAVEEQATSRSHRLGQERPVTVYRMVTEGTIEERILEMHEDKRSLAQGLLAGIDKAKKLDLDQIKSLLGAL